MTQAKRILLTGATGYVGGRLRPRLAKQGCLLRCMTRRGGALADRIGSEIEVVVGDVFEPETLREALAGVHTAYYLIHSMGSDQDFEERDREGASHFGNAAREAGVQRIIYLGGLAHGNKLSAHLRSRHEVGELLRKSGVPVLEFRASVVLGSGSLSFEMLRALVERLPIMITPRWVRVKAQPIAIDDLLTYLVAALDLPMEQSRTFEIGGADQISYGELMREYARQRGLHRAMLSVPVLTPRLSSLWLGLVTPIYARVGRKLVQSIKHPSIIKDPSALEAFAIRPRGMSAAIASALTNEDREIAESRWFDAFSSGGESRSWVGVRFGNRLADSRSIDVNVPADIAFTPIRRIGGETGWYAYNWLWRLRGFLDLLVGGVGVRRGRANPEQIHVGDAIDFWRVEAHEPNHVLRLQAEMKIPGRAQLEFEVVSTPQGSTIRQTALYDPVGLFGLLYWYMVLPLHGLVFKGMLRNIARAAEEQQARVSRSKTS
ncbi:MAG: hypothetical protein ACI9X4_000924 [Glaciecola sp.]|jgi:uncharacterized protein YbjT (DUF2867 family)